MIDINGIEIIIEEYEWAQYPVKEECDTKGCEKCLIQQ